MSSYAMCSISRVFRVGRRLRVSAFFSGLFSLGLALILDVRHISVLVGRVRDDLCAAIGKKDSVRASDDLAVALLFVGIVVLARLILDRPRELVRLRLQSLRRDIINNN